jgi:hypothetical protein
MASTLEIEIMGKANRLMDDISYGSGTGPVVLEFHFNTKLAHCLTDWVKLIREKPENEKHYRNWCDQAARFVEGLPGKPVVSGKTGESIDPLRSAREVFPAPASVTPGQDLHQVAVAMHECALRAGGDRKRHYGINQDHLNLVEIAAELGLIPGDKVLPMTRRCLGKEQTTAESNRQFDIETNAGRLLTQNSKPTFTLLDDTPGHRAGVLNLLGYWGGECRFPVAFVDTSREHLIVAIEPRNAKGTSVTNLAEKVMTSLGTMTKHLRHPAQTVRFFEVYEDQIEDGKVSEVFVKNGLASWKHGEAVMVPKIMAAARHACRLATTKVKPPEKKTLAQTLQKVQDHGFTLNLPAPIAPSPVRESIDR